MICRVLIEIAERTAVSSHRTPTPLYGGIFQGKANPKPVGGVRMKDTGIVRRMDELGRIVIPMELRAVLGIEQKDPLEVYFDEEDRTIMLLRYQPGCFFCGTIDQLAEFRGRKICQGCMKKAKATSWEDLYSG